MPTFVLTSTSFKANDYLPRVHANPQYGPGALNKSPALSWSHAPEGTKTFALICKDPDAVGGTFIHWVMYNIPATVSELPSGILQTAEVQPIKAEQGRNSYRQTGYGGPNPPVGTGVHRYIFTLYALDKHLDLPPSSTTASELENAMNGHILASTDLIGLFAAPH